MTDNGYILELSGWESFFTAVEHHWLTALLIVIALIIIAGALSPTINVYNNEKKGEKV